jgi:hypothetical protein
MRRLFCILVGLSLACSGGGDSGIEPVNQPPTISFSFSKIGVVRSVPVNLSVAVDDPDGDPLTVSWTITRSTLTPQNAANTVMSWAAPATLGVDTVEVSVTDGTATRRVTEVIKVGWPATGATTLFQKSRSPYIVSGLLVGVGEGAITTIEAGTELLLEEEGVVIDVTGDLVSLGTGAEPVVIRPNVRGLACGDERGWWEGIQVARSSGAPEAGTIELHHTEVWYAQHGVRLNADASAELEGCAIKCSGEAGVLHSGSGKLRMIDTEVSNGLLNGIVIGSNVSTAIPDSILIERCTIEFNEASGLVVNIDDQAQEASIVVEFNELSRNLVRAITLARASFPAVHFNYFTGNGVSAGVSNIYLEGGYPNGVPLATLNATCNFFGVTNQASIDATIRDSLDSGSVGTRVDTDPWLAANPLTTPPICTP